MSLLALARANEIDFGATEEPGWFPFNFEESIVYDLIILGDPICSFITHAAVPVRYHD